MFVTNCISTTKIQKISEITNFFRHYFLSRTEVQNAFNLYIPVKVKYGWGEIVTDPIKVNVATTIQANARKK